MPLASSRVDPNKHLEDFAYAVSIGALRRCSVIAVCRSFGFTLVLHLTRTSAPIRQTNTSRIENQPPIDEPNEWHMGMPAHDSFDIIRQIIKSAGRCSLDALGVGGLSRVLLAP